MTGTLEQQALEALQGAHNGTACEDRDEEWAGFYAGRRADPEPPQEEDAPTSPVEALSGLLTPLTPEEIGEARVPHPHAFQARSVGLFPVGEVSVVASAGREGKTTVEVGMATAMAIGHTLAGLFPLPDRTVVVYSAEDDRRQFAAKIGAQCSLVSEAQAALIRERLLVPNLDDLPMMRELVMTAQGAPMASGAVEVIIEALRPLMACQTPPGLLVFETASTLSEVEESNLGLGLLVKALKRIARELQVAVLVSHHVSQVSLANLPDLNLSTADIRGGTALVNNARQTAMLVNLGSDEDPFPDNDARTVLRRLVAGSEPGKVTAWITLDSSKSISPPPVFFRWITTEWGPAAVEMDPPAPLAERSWRKVLEMVRAERAEAKAEAKQAARNENLELVVKLVGQLEQSGKQPTARAVSIAAGRSQTWARPYLEAAAEDGELVRHSEPVPRASGKQDVYRLPDSTAVTA